MKHSIHYLPLFVIFCLGVFGFMFFAYDRAAQIALSVALSASYLSWGIVHHKIHKNLDLFVFCEYLVISTVGFVMLATLILRAA